MIATTILSSLVGAASLPVFELDRTHVGAPGKKVRPFDPQRGFLGDPKCPSLPPGELALNSWRLAHAVKKADCVRPTLHRWAGRIAFWLDQLTVLDWRHSNLRLLRGASEAHLDFFGSSLAGRIGQGVAILLMEDKGYRFVSHYPRQANVQGPDFLVENSGSGAVVRAMVESKGSFGQPKERTPIKEVLREGLNQLSGVPAHGASKSFVVGTFLREYGDTYPEPSLVAFVDPDQDSGTSQLPEDWVRRQNYAAWLDAMGLHYSASDLRLAPRERTVQRTQVRLLRIGGLEFGVVILGFLTYGDQHSVVSEQRPLRHAVVAGLPRTLLESIGRVLRSPEETVEAADIAQLRGLASSVSEQAYLSVLMDGSLLGSLPLEQVSDAQSATIEL